MKEGAESAGRGFLVDPSLPRWVCQACRHPLCIVGAESFADRVGMDPISRPAVHAASSEKMDHSFVVLHKSKNSNFPPPRPRPPIGQGLPPVSERHHQTEASGATRALDESFVVLPSSAASMYRVEHSPSAESGGFHPGLNSPVAAAAAAEGMTNLHPSNATFNANIHVLTRVFDIASSQSQVEQPLCLECMSSLSEELDKQTEEISRDIRAYEAYINGLEKEQDNALSEDEFLKEKQKVEVEERKIEAALQVVERQNEEVFAQLQELELKSKNFHELEERFWHDFNDFKLQLTVHQEERDAVLAKIEVSEAQLEMLKHTNVLNDAFHITYEGEFGTINNFRLGRLPLVSVEWEEMNAAWGQACLLLYTMAQYCHLTLTYRIIPMGSYPRIADSKNTYQLYGPVNLFWSTRYDKAMALFLACIKEFADFANSKDRAANVPPDKWFKLPYKIENDKVDGLTITQSFNTPEKWTKALKYMLCDLKWALFWLIGNTTFEPPASAAAATSAGRMKTPVESRLRSQHAS